MTRRKYLETDESGLTYENIWNMLPVFAILLRCFSKVPIGYQEKWWNLIINKIVKREVVLFRFFFCFVFVYICLVVLLYVLVYSFVCLFVCLFFLFCFMFTCLVVLFCVLVLVFVFVLFCFLVCVWGVCVGVCVCVCFDWHDWGTIFVIPLICFVFQTITSVIWMGNLSCVQIGLYALQKSTIVIKF